MLYLASASNRFVHATMAADVFLVNFSMLTAFALWFLFYVVILQTPDPQATRRAVQEFCDSLLAAVVFPCASGISAQWAFIRASQKRWRGAQGRLAVFRGCQFLFIVLFVFADYFLYRGALVPRGVAVIAMGSDARSRSVGFASRSIRSLKRYHVELKTDPESVRQVLVLGGSRLFRVRRRLRGCCSVGSKLRVLDSFLFGENSGWRMLKTHPSCELVRGDIRDIGAVVKAMKGCDAAVHFAAIVGDPACEENKQLAIEVNRAATRMLADVAQRVRGAAVYFCVIVWGVWGIRILSG
jgi:hypothetical protein